MSPKTFSEKSAVQPLRYLVNIHVNQFPTIVDALEAAPANRPFVTAWIDEDEQEALSFGEFRIRARSQAVQLCDHSVGPGDRVIIVMPQGISAMAAFVGAMMLGAVPSYLAYPNFKVDPSKYRSGLAGVTKNLCAKVVVIDKEFPEDMLDCVSTREDTDLLRAGEEAEQVANIHFPEWERRPEGLAFIQHSAGTTGLQKGVALTHAAVLRQLGHLSRALDINADNDRIYSWLPLYHDMGLIACFILPMVLHVPVVMQSPMDWVMHPETMLQIISKHRCTLAWMPNFAFQFIPRRTPKNRWHDYDLSSIRALINCSEPVRAASMMEFRNAFGVCGLKSNALHSSYAMAENVFAVTQSEISSSGPRRIWVDAHLFRLQQRAVPVAEATPGAVSFVSSGQLLAHHKLRITSQSSEIQEGAGVGEILIQSDCLFDGYYNRPDLTADAIKDGWYHTGDLGFCLDGELFVVGRKKDLLIVGGENIYPQDVEELVASHASVHDGRVIALGMYNPDLGTDEIMVVAEVETQENLSESEQIEKEIRGLVVGGLGVSVRTIFLKPAKWIVKSTSGKPARSGTREKLLGEHPELNTNVKEI